MTVLLKAFHLSFVLLESYDFCQWILSASGQCDMGHGIIQAARCNTYLLHSMYYLGFRGKYILYIHNLPHLAPKNRDLQGVLIMLDHIFINVSIFSRNLWSCISPLATFFNDLKRV